MTDLQHYMEDMGRRAKAASRTVGSATTQVKNAALEAIAYEIEQATPELLAANKLDMDAGADRGLDDALLDRLALNNDRIAAMASGLRDLVALPDPVGEIDHMAYRPSGIQVGMMRVPLGVIGIIYESRPNVTADAAGLCLKSGNAVILRGGSESVNSNQAIARCIQKGLASVGLPKESVQVVDVIDRTLVRSLVQMTDYVDVVVPRGGQGLMDIVMREATVPVLKHLHGICHVYIDQAADIKKAMSIAFNAKTQRYGTCNTMETLLVSEVVADRVLPLLAEMYQKAGVEMRGCESTRKLLSGIAVATDVDWSTEYLAPILSIRVVKDVDAAMTHIRNYGSGHTDAIVTEDLACARRFLREVDSSSVMVNASTRFADGYEYGLGAEIGISTGKLHARGPVGLEGLTSQKYIVIGDGHIRG